MMILPVNVEFVGAVSEIIINYYYWQEWKIVKKKSKTQVAYELSGLFYFTSYNFECKTGVVYIFFGSLLKFLFKIYVAHE